jgi:glycosyltransferase involved in cell wall biosynthesis
MKSVVFSAHALSTNEKQKIQKLIGNEIHYLSLFELKQTKSMASILKEIVSLRNLDNYVFMDFENAELLKGFLYALPMSGMRFTFKTIEPGGVIRKKTIISSLFQLGLMGFTTFWNFFFGLIFYLMKFAVSRMKVTSYENVDFNKFKKCLYLKTNFWFGIQAGGSIGHISGVANRLADFFEVTYMSPDEPQLLEPSVKIVSVDSTYRFSLPYELNNLGFNLPFLTKIRYFKDADFFYQRLSLYNFSGILMSLLLKKPLILEYNGSEVWIQKNWSAGLKYPKLAAAIEDFNLTHAARIVTVSEVLRDELIAQGYDKNKIVFYPNCIDPIKYSPDIISEEEKTELRKSIGLNDQHFIFTFVGTFGPWHGVEFLIEGINNFFKNSSNDNSRFLLVGDGVLKKKCESLLNPEFKQKVLFLGLVPQSITPMYLAISDCFLSPHVKREGEKFFGSPTKLFEYMAMRKPVIASSLEQLSNLFESPVKDLKIQLAEKSDGLLFEPNNIEEFTSQMEFVLNLKKKEAEAIGQNARDLALKKYTWKRHVEVILSGHS